MNTEQQLNKRINQLEAALSASVEREDKLLKLLSRVKKTLEPFPVVADLKSLKNTLKQARISKDEKVNVQKLHNKWQAKTRKLYRDIERALKDK